MKTYTKRTIQPPKHIFIYMDNDSAEYMYRPINRKKSKIKKGEWATYKLIENNDTMPNCILVRYEYILELSNITEIDCGSFHIHTIAA